METVTTQLKELQARVEDGFMRVDQRFQELRSELNAFRESMEARFDRADAKWQGKIDVVQAKIDQDRVTLEAKLREDRAALEAKLREDRLALEAKLKEDRVEFERKMEAQAGEWKHNHEQSEARLDRLRAESDEKWQRAQDRRDAMDREHRTSMRWLTGSMVTLLVTLVGLVVGKAAHFY